MPGQLFNLPFLSQVEDMDKYLLEYRSLKLMPQQQTNSYQNAAKYNTQTRQNVAQSAAQQSQAQSHMRKKNCENSTALNQTANYNLSCRQQTANANANAHANGKGYNQQSSQSVTSLYNKAVHQQAYASNFYMNYNSSNSSGNIPGNSANVGPSQALGSSLVSQGQASHSPFTPTSSVTPPPVPTGLSSTLSSASIGSSVGNDLDFLLPSEMGTRSMSQPNRFMAQQPQGYGAFGTNFIEQSFSQGHDFMNSLTPTSSVSHDSHEQTSTFNKPIYPSTSLSSNFMMGETGSAWNNESVNQSTVSSASIWNNDMSVWS